MKLLANTGASLIPGAGLPDTSAVGLIACPRCRCHQTQYLAAIECWSPNPIQFEFVLQVDFIRYCIKDFIKIRCWFHLCLLSVLLTMQASCPLKEEKKKKQLGFLSLIQFQNPGCRLPPVPLKSKRLQKLTVRFPALILKEISAYQCLTQLPHIPTLRPQLFGTENPT